MPKVPRVFIEHPKIKYVLYHTIDEFDFEEKEAIYFYCILDLPISEIAKIIGISQNHVASALGLYSERLNFKLDVFKKAISYDTNDVLHVSEVLFLELAECEVT